MIQRSLIPTTAPDEVLRPANWSGLTVIWRSASHTPEDIPMPDTGVGISLIGDERSRWRLGRGDTQTRVLVPGSVFIFAGDDFTWAENTTPYAGVALGFDLPLLRRTAERAGLDGSAVQLRSHHFHDDAHLLALAKLMGNEARHGGIGGALYQDSLATAALIHLLRHYAGVQSIGRNTTAGLSPDRLRRVLDFMHEHLDRQLTLSDLAAVAHLSPFHFARSFKLATGRPPHVYLNGMRMDRARTLLLATGEPVAEVAVRVGFANAGHFSSQFRRAFGVTPREFRAKL